MRILKLGVLETKEFACKNCGCIFEADESEYATCEYLISNVIIHEVNCPCCKKLLKITE